jgi:hypothetical protein
MLGTLGTMLFKVFFYGTEEDLWIDVSAALRKDSVCCQFCRSIIL